MYGRYYTILITVGLLLMGWSSICAQGVDKIYEAKYSNEKFEELAEVGSNKKIVGDPLSKHIIKVYPSSKGLKSLGAKLVEKLNLAPKDTVIMVSSYLNLMPGECFSFIKTNNKIYSVTIDANKGRKKPEEGLIFHPLFEKFPTNKITISYSEMIMLNVFFSWNWEDMLCLLQSNPAGSEGNIATRYTVKDGIITSATTIKYDQALIWKMNDCYDDYIPDKYLHDIRYESPDSTLNRYLDKYPLNMFYKKRDSTPQE